MPREVMRFESARRRPMWLYRLVAAHDGQTRFGVIERQATDAMGAEVWQHVSVRDEPEVVWDLLAALAHAHVEFPKVDGAPVTFAVQSHDTPEHSEDV